MNSLLEARFTVDAFLGGRVEALQAGDGGHRSGLEAVILAAAIEDSFDGVVVDLGAGTGVAGMCVAARSPLARVTLVDRDAAALSAAREALARPANRGFADRVSVVAADVTAPEPVRIVAGLERAFADAVIFNPPFHRAAENTHAPHTGRAAAHVLGDDELGPWARTAASVLKPDGRAVAIFRADGLTELLAALAGRFGAVAILPLHPRAGSRAHRILVRAIKGSRAGLVILPGLTLHGTSGSAYLPEAEALLRDGKSLAEAHPAWAG